MTLFQRDTLGLPYPNLKSVSRLSSIISVTSAIAAGVLGVLLPLQGVQRLLGAASNPLNKYYAFALFILLLISVVSFMLMHVFENAGPKEERADQLAQPKAAKGILVFQCVASLLILAQTISQIHMPFDLDENQRAAAAVTKSFWHETTPFRHTEVHTVAHVAAILSMKALGENKVAFRLPSIVFTVLFLLVLNLFASRFLSPFTSVLVFSHLLVNEMTIWYMHAMRGYISSMFFTTILFFLLMEVTRALPTERKQKLILFFLAFFLSVLSHPFTGIFALLLVLTLVQWLWLNRSTVGTERLRYASQLISLAVLLVPFFVVVFVCVLKSLEPIANVHAGGFEKFVDPLFQTLPALGRAWAVRVVAALLLIAGLFRLVRFKRITLDFYSLFVVNTFFFFGAVLLLLKVSHLEPRWFIPFLVPFLFWAGEWVSAIPQMAVRRGVMASLFVLFTALPFQMRHGILDRLGIWYHARYENFLEMVRRETGPVEKNCYLFPDIPMGDWAEQFYFIDSPKTPAEKAACENHYVVSLELGQVVPSEPHTLVVDAGHGNAVYKINN